jgi:hypothetical protein
VNWHERQYIKIADRLVDAESKRLKLGGRPFLESDGIARGGHVNIGQPDRCSQCASLPEQFLSPPGGLLNSK